MAAQRWSTVVCSALAALSACLPADTRPEPGSVYVTAEPSEATLYGFVTSDRWRIHFERLLVGLGDISLEDDACNSYADTHYDRLFDFVVAGRQKLGLAYGLGSCSLHMRLRPPSLEALLGAGVTIADQTFMRTPGSDAYASDDRTSVYALGTATRARTTKRFEWRFRLRYPVGGCIPGVALGENGVVDLEGGKALDRRVIVRGEEIFRASEASDGPLTFDEMANADTDGDGLITLDELDKVDVPSSSMDAGMEPKSLTALLYAIVVPRIVHIDGSSPCPGTLPPF